MHTLSPRELLPLSTLQQHMLTALHASWWSALLRPANRPGAQSVSPPCDCNYLSAPARAPENRKTNERPDFQPKKKSQNQFAATHFPEPTRNVCQHFCVLSVFSGDFPCFCAVCPLAKYFLKNLFTPQGARLVHLIHHIIYYCARHNFKFNADGLYVDNQ